VLAALGTGGGAADFNGDGMVDAADYGIARANLGRSLSPYSLP